MPYYTKAKTAYKNNNLILAGLYAKQCLYTELETLNNDEIYEMFFIISETDLYKKALKNRCLNRYIAY